MRSGRSKNGWNQPNNLSTAKTNALEQTLACSGFAQSVHIPTTADSLVQVKQSTLLCSQYLSAHTHQQPCTHTPQPKDVHDFTRQSAHQCLMNQFWVPGKRRSSEQAEQSVSRVCQSVVGLSGACPGKTYYYLETTQIPMHICPTRACDASASGISDMFCLMIVQDSHNSSCSQL